MKEARCHSVNGGIVPAGSYIAGPTFGDFHRSTQDKTTKSFTLNETRLYDAERDSNDLEKRHRPHRDYRKFLMLVDENGEMKFKACSPTCVDVKWGTVPFRKRIPGFGRKSRGQKSMPKDFIPTGLTSAEESTTLGNVESHRPSDIATAFPNITPPHTPWTEDVVSYRAVMSTPLDIDFEKCVSHMQPMGKSWTEEERCHRINWGQIPINEIIAGFGRKISDSMPTSLPDEHMSKRTDTDLSRLSRVTNSLPPPIPGFPFYVMTESWPSEFSFQQCTDTLGLRKRTMKLDRWLHCAIVDWNEIPVGQYIDGFGRKKSQDFPQNIDIDTTSQPVKRSYDDWNAVELATFLYPNPDDPSDVQMFMAVRDDGNSRVTFLECSVGSPPGGHEDDEVLACKELEYGYNLCTIMGAGLGYFSWFHGFQQIAATAILMMVTSSGALYCVFGYILGSLLVIGGACWMYIRTGDFKKKER